MKMKMKQSIKMWTYHTIRTQWNTFTVFIWIKWEWWVLSLAWNMWIAESDNIVPYMSAASSKWPWLGSKRMTGSMWEPLHWMLQTALANSIFCFSVSKDFFLFGIYRIKRLHPWMLFLESDYLYKNNSSAFPIPYWTTCHEDDEPWTFWGFSRYCYFQTSSCFQDENRFQVHGFQSSYGLLVQLVGL